MIIESNSAKILAVIVSYNPDLGSLDEAVKALVGQGVEVLVIDNGSANQAELVSYELNVKRVLNADNLGLGAAHNQGLKFAVEHEFEYLLILDQDSLPLEDMVASLLDAHRQKSTSHKVSAVGACYLNSDNQSESFFVRFGALKFQRSYPKEGVVKADFLISSGSLFSVAALQSIGGMDESLFIDHVDTEWFLRARSQGYQAFGVGAARMQHGLGERTHRMKFARRERNVPQHQPFRYYYIFRNSVALYKRGYASFLWKWNDLQRLAAIFVMFGLVKAPRWRNLQMMLLGLWHGLRGKSGKAEFHSKPAHD